MNASDVSASQISLREILLVIFRRKIPIILCTAIVSTITLTAASRTQSVYVASVKILLKREGPSPLAMAWVPFYGLEEEMNTEAEIVKTRPVLQRAVEILKEAGVSVAVTSGDSIVARDPTVGDLAQGVSAVPIETSNIMLVTFKGVDARFVKEAANAIAEAYIEHRVMVRRASGIQEYFRDELAKLDARIISLRERELALRKEGAIFDFEYQQRVTLSRKNEVQLDLAAVRTKRLAEEGKLAAIKRRLEEDPDLVLPFPDFGNDPLIADMLGDYWSLSGERDQKASYLTESNPEVRMLDDRLERLKQRFGEEIQRKVKEKEFLIEDLKAEEAGYEDEINEILAELRATPEVVAQIDHLQKEIASTYLHYDRLVEKMLDTMVSQANDVRISNAKVISPAMAELTRSRRMRSVYVTFAVVLGMTLGVGFGFLLETLDHSVKSASDVEDVVGTTLLGSVPEDRKISEMTHGINNQFRGRSL